MTTEILAPHFTAGIETVQGYYQGLSRPLGKDILDAGCGDGRNARFLAGLGYSVLAVDPYGIVLPHVGLRSLAQDSQAGSVTYMSATLDDHELDDRTFDGIICNEVIDLLRQTKVAHLLRRLEVFTGPMGYNFISWRPTTSRHAIPRAYVEDVYSALGWRIISSGDAPYQVEMPDHATVLGSVSHVIAIKQ